MDNAKTPAPPRSLKRLVLQTGNRKSKETRQCIEYIRAYYGVACYIGQRVRFEGRDAVIIGAKGAYLRLWFSGTRKRDGLLYHPTWHMEYLPEQSAKSENVKDQAPEGLPASACSALERREEDDK